MSKVLPLNKTMGIMDIDSNFHGVFSYNQFSEDIEYVKEPIWDSGASVGKNLDDEDLTNIRYYISI